MPKTLRINVSLRSGRSIKAEIFSSRGELLWATVSPVKTSKAALKRLYDSIGRLLTA